MSLYQKYRPQCFDSLAGQEHIKLTLQNALRKDLVSHAYLFCGPRGTGKTTTARLIAKCLNCSNFDNEKVEPCNECSICKQISDSSLIDVIEIDAASNRGIDEMRELKETIRFAPTIAKNKIYIIDEVHMLTNEAFNALLKTLEEPPSNVFFVLATTEVHKIPETILSRCQRFDFKRIDPLSLVGRLEFIAKEENIKYEVEALEMISAYSDGGLRDAISILDQLAVSGEVAVSNTKSLLGSTGMDTLKSFVNFLLTKNDKAAFEVINNLHEQGSDIKQFQLEILKIAREMLHTAIEKDDLEMKSRLISFIELWQEIQNSFKVSVVAELPLEVLVVKFCNVLQQNPLSVEIPTVKIPKSAVKKEAVEEIKIVEKVENPIKIETTNTILEVGLSQVPVEPVAENPIKITSAEDKERITDSLEVMSGNMASEAATAIAKSNAEARKPVEKAQYSDQEIERNWKKIIEKITVPTLRINLKTCSFKRTGEASGEVLIPSNFQFEAIKRAENLRVLEDLLYEVTGKVFKIDLKLEKVKINFETDHKTAPVNSYSPKAAAPAIDNSLPDFDPPLAEHGALEFFEGEFIE